MTRDQLLDKHFKENGPHKYQDRNTERNFNDMQVEQVLNPPRRSHYFPVLTRKESTEEILTSIEKENAHD